MYTNYVQVSTKEELNSLLNNNSIYKLYKDCFGEPPYEEVFSNTEVSLLFHNYFQKGIIIFCLDAYKKNILGFVAAIPLICEAEIAAIAKDYGFDPATDWYYADAGVARLYRRNGIGKQLAVELIKTIPAKKIIMRTHEKNIASQKCHQKVGFSIIDGMYQDINKERISGNIEVDRRIFLCYDKNLKGK